MGAHRHGLGPDLRLIKTSVALVVRGRCRAVGLSAESVGSYPARSGYASGSGSRSEREC